MPDLLPLRLSSSMVIVLGFDQGTCLMSWAHVIHMICASKLKGPDVLRNPTLPYAVDFFIAEDASPTRCFPHLQAAMRRELSASGCSHILNMDERHKYSS